VSSRDGPEMSSKSTGCKRFGLRARPQNRRQPKEIFRLWHTGGVPEKKGLVMLAKVKEKKGPTQARLVRRDIQRNDVSAMRRGGRNATGTRDVLRTSRE